MVRDSWGGIAAIVVTIVLISGGVGSGAGSGIVGSVSAQQSASIQAESPAGVSVDDVGNVGVVDVSEDDGNITLEFNQSVESGTGSPVTADNFEVYIRDAGTGDFVEWNGTSSVRPISDADVVTQDGGTDVVLDGAGLWGDLSPADGIKVTVTNVRASGTNGSFDLGNTTVRASAAVLDSGDDNYRTEDSARRLYQGMPITLKTQNDNTPFMVQNVDTNQTVLERATGVNSRNSRVDTGDMDVGTYRLVVNPENNPNQNMNNKGPRQVKYVTVYGLELQATLGADGRLFEHGEPAGIDVSGSAIRGNAQLAVEVRDADGTLRTVYASRLDNRAEFDFSANVSAGDIGAGNYTVTVIDVSTGVSVEAGTFSVGEPPSATAASFMRGGIYEGVRGDVVEIPISLRDSGEGAQAFVSVGSLGENDYVTNVTIADTNGDGEVVLEFNTSMAGVQNLTGDESAVFTAQGVDTVDSMRDERGDFVSNLSAQADAAGLSNSLAAAELATLEAGPYELSVTAAEDGDFDGDINFSDNGLDAQDIGRVDLGTRSIPGVGAEKSTALAGSDGTVGRQDVLDAVAAYLRDQPRNGVELSRSDIIAVVQYYLTR